MKKIVPIFLFLSLFCIKSNIVFASDASCTKIVATPEIALKTSYGNLTYNREKTNKELTEIGKKFGVVEKGLFAAGLSTIKINWEISVDTMSKVPEGSEDICIVPIKLNLYVGYEEPTIYISKELQEGTCEYDVVLRHEQTHQQINKTALEYYIFKIKALLPEVAKEVGVKEISSLREIGAANMALTKEYISLIEPMIETFKAELKREQSKLDNMQNYEMEGELCKKKALNSEGK